MRLIKELENKIEDLDNYVKVMEGKVNYLLKKIDSLNAVEKTPQNVKYVPLNPYLTQVGGDGVGIDKMYMDSSYLEDETPQLQNLITSDVSILFKCSDCGRTTTYDINKNVGNNLKSTSTIQRVCNRCQSTQGILILKFVEQPPYALFYPDQEI